MLPSISVAPMVSLVADGGIPGPVWHVLAGAVPALGRRPGAGTGLSRAGPGAPAQKGPSPFPITAGASSSLLSALSQKILKRKRHLLPAGLKFRSEPFP